MNSKCLYFSIYLSLFLVFEISACNAGTTTTTMPQTNSTTAKSSGTTTIKVTYFYPAQPGMITNYVFTYHR